MALTIHPRAGIVLMCDFTGSVNPEMNKTRPVIVISPKSLPRRRLYTVIPLSTSVPDPIAKYHYRFEKNPVPGRYEETWAKCDMVTTVSVDRLDRVKVGRGLYKTAAITAEELEAIRMCLKFSLGFEAEHDPGIISPIPAPAGL